MLQMFLLFVSGFGEFCRLEASSTAVSLVPSTPNTSSRDFAVKTIPDDGSSGVKAPGPHDPSWSAVKAPYSNRVGYCLRILLVLPTPEIRYIQIK